MNFSKIVLKWILAPILLFFLLQIILSIIFNERLLGAVFAGYLIPTINYLIGFAAFNFGIKKTEKAFIKSVVGGIVFRLLLSLILVLISLKFLELNLNSFIFSIFIFYGLYLLLEIIYLNRKNFS